MFNTLDLIIILTIIIGAIVGFCRGFIKQGVMTIGFIVVFILSYLLKNPVSSFMYEHLPFFNFNLIIKNSTVINILVYELIAFLIAFSVLEIAFIILVRISSIIQELIKITKVLKIPSKVLGAIFGAVQYYVIVFIVLFVLSFPTFNFNSKEIFKNSKLAPIVLNNTVGISNVTENALETFNEINKLLKDKDTLNAKEFDCEALNIMKKRKFITEKSYKYLYRTGKIRVTCD